MSECNLIIAAEQRFQHKVFFNSMKVTHCCLQLWFGLLSSMLAVSIWLSSGFMLFLFFHPKNLNWLQNEMYTSSFASQSLYNVPSLLNHLWGSYQGFIFFQNRSKNNCIMLIFFFTAVIHNFFLNFTSFGDMWKIFDFAIRLLFSELREMKRYCKAALNLCSFKSVRTTWDDTF